MTGIVKQSAAVCCWCQGPLVQVASSPGIWWCLTPACFSKQRSWGLSRQVTEWSKVDGVNVPKERTERLFIPTPRQVQYMECPATYRLFGGAAGPGKSTAARRGALYRQCLQIPGYEALILRETFPELERTHLRRMAVEADDIGATFIESKRLLKFPNGSLIECGHMDDDAALRKYLSSEYDHIVADEGSNFDPMNLLELSTRARTSKPAVLAAGGAKFDVVSNPGGRAASMLKDLFIDHVVDADRYPVLASSDESGKPFYDPAQWAYIPATLDDNPYIDPAYVRSLAVLQPWRYEQLRRGDWNVFAGAFFSSWSSAKHVRDVRVIDPKTATWIRALDWGYHDPCVIGWFAVLPDGHYHCVAELKLKEHLVSDVAREVAAMDRTLGLPTPVSATRTYADPAVRQRGGQTGESIQETFGKAGMPLIPSVNERKNGWMRVQALLKDAPDGVPYLTFARECKYLTRSIAGAMSDPKEPDDLLQHDDHGLDMCFPADTMIWTEDGDRPIVDLRVGDRVWTREGLKPVDAVFHVGEHDTVIVDTDDGQSLRGTPDHRVWTDDRGFVAMSSIRYGDMMRSCIPTSIATSPGLSGDVIAAPFHGDSTFIAKTATPPITTSLTWSASAQPITSAVTSLARPNSLRIVWSVVERLKSSRTYQAVASSAHAIADRLVAVVPAPMTFQWSAYPAGAYISVTATEAAAIVRENALALASMNAPLFTPTADSVNEHSRQKMRAPAGAPTSVVSVRSGSRSAVYNLTVADVHEYYANGLLVANCRYFAMSRPMPRSKEAAPKPVEGMAGFILDQAIRESRTAVAA